MPCMVELQAQWGHEHEEAIAAASLPLVLLREATGSCARRSETLPPPESAQGRGRGVYRLGLPGLERVFPSCLARREALRRDRNTGFPADARSPGQNPTPSAGAGGCVLGLERSLRSPRRSPVPTAGEEEPGSAYGRSPGTAHSAACMSRQLDRRFPIGNRPRASQESAWKPHPHPVPHRAASHRGPTRVWEGAGVGRLRSLGAPGCRSGGGGGTVLRDLFLVADKLLLASLRSQAAIVLTTTVPGLQRGGRPSCEWRARASTPASTRLRWEQPLLGFPTAVSGDRVADGTGAGAQGLETSCTAIPGHSRELDRKWSN
nr:uncharacterized protein LOC127493673 [Oryctolagus cuniculus]